MFDLFKRTKITEEDEVALGLFATKNLDRIQNAPQPPRFRIDISTTSVGGPQQPSRQVEDEVFTPPTDVFNQPPGITDIYPPHGPNNGGIDINLTGTGFVVGATVTFDGVSATVTFLSSTNITVTLPADDVTGYVDVVVTNTDHSTITSPGGFKYNNELDITSVNPSTGPAGGGITVTIYGTGFTNDMRIVFGGSAVDPFVVADDGSYAQLTLPAHVATTVDIDVYDDDTGQHSVLSHSFTYTGVAEIVDFWCDPTNLTSGATYDVSVHANTGLFDTGLDTSYNGTCVIGIIQDPTLTVAVVPGTITFVNGIANILVEAINPGTPSPRFFQLRFVDSANGLNLLNNDGAGFAVF